MLKESPLLEEISGASKPTAVLVASGVSLNWLLFLGHHYQGYFPAFSTLLLFQLGHNLTHQFFIWNAHHISSLHQFSCQWGHLFVAIQYFLQVPISPFNSFSYCPVQRVSFKATWSRWACSSKGVGLSDLQRCLPTLIMLACHHSAKSAFCSSVTSGSAHSKSWVCPEICFQSCIWNFFFH